MGQILTIGASATARTIAHEVQNEYHRSWKAIAVSNENGCVCGCCHDELGGKDELDA